MRYAIALGFGYPCWLPPYACKPANFQERYDYLAHRTAPVITSLPALEAK